MKGRVFISHAREDAPVIEPIVELLEARGVTPWIDRRDIPVSVPWLDDALRAIDGSDLIVIFDSPSFTASDACNVEQQHAERRGKDVLRLSVEGFDPERGCEAVVAALAGLSPASRLRTEVWMSVDEWLERGRSRRALLSVRALLRFRTLAFPQDAAHADVRAFFRASRRRLIRRVLSVTGVTLSGLILLGLLSVSRTVTDKQNATARQLDAELVALRNDEAAGTLDAVAALRKAVQGRLSEPQSSFTLNRLEQALAVPLPSARLALGRADIVAQLPLPGNRGARLLTAAGTRIDVTRDAAGTLRRSAGPAESARLLGAVSSSDGRVVVAMAGRRRLRIERAGVPPITRIAPRPLVAVAVSADGTTVVGATAHSVAFPATRAPAWVPVVGAGTITSVAAVPGARPAAIAGLSSGAVVVVAGSRRQRVLQANAVRSDAVPSIAYSARADLAAFSTSRTGVIRVVRVATGETVARLIAPGSASELSFSPDGRYLTGVGERDEVEIWDIGTGLRRSPLRTYGGRPTTILWSADASSITATTTTGALLRWSIPGRRLLDDPAQVPVAVLRARAAGRLVVVDQSGAVRELDRRSLKPSRTYRTSVTGVFRAAISPSARFVGLLSLDDDELHLSDLTSSGAVRAFAVPDCKPQALAFIDDSRLAIGCLDGRIVRMRVSGQQISSIQTQQGEIESIDVDPVHGRLVVGTYFGQFFVLDGRGRLIAHFPRPPLRAVASEDRGSIYAAVGEGGGMTTGSILFSVGDPGGGGTLYGFRQSPSEATRARCVAFSPAGDRIAVGLDDGVVDIIEMGRQSLARSFLLATPGPVMGLAFSADGSSLVVASRFGVVTVLPGSAEYARPGGVLAVARATLARVS